MTNDELVVSDPDILGGTPMFSGTRVPVKNFTDGLAGGDSLDAVMDDFPSLQRDQAAAFLEAA